MRLLLSCIALAAALVLPARAGEVVHLEIERQTTLGQSVYALAEWPRLGGGAILRSVKLSPHDYPVWKASFEVPPGVAFTPRYYTRPDAPESAGSASGAVQFATGDAVSAPAEGPGLPIVLLLDEPADGPAFVAIHESPDGPAVLQIPMASRAAGDLVEHGALVPDDLARMGRFYRVHAGGQAWPTDGTAARLVPAPVWWRFGEAFLWDPSDLESAPSAPRRADFQIGLEGFQSRTIRVQLPRGYDEQPGRAYPVVYALDGQNVFAPGGAFGSWDLDLAMARMAAQGEIPDAILVGIDNTSDRFAEYTPDPSTGIPGATGRGGEFLDRIEDTLLPRMAADFRVLPGADGRVLIGSSLGGLLGYYAAAERGDAWGAAIAMSPSFWAALAPNQARADQPPSAWSRVWIDSGTAGGGSADGYWNTYAMRDRMIASGHALGSRFWHTLGIGAQHNEAAWRARSPEALRWAFGPWMEDLGDAHRLAAGQTRWMVSGTGE